MTQSAHDTFDVVDSLFSDAVVTLQENPTDPLHLVTLRIIHVLQHREYGGAARIFTAPRSLDETFVLHKVYEILAIAARNQLFALEGIIRTAAEPLHPNHGVPQFFPSLNRIVGLIALRDPLLALSVHLEMLNIARHFGESDIESFLCRRCYGPQYGLNTSTAQVRH